MTPFRRRGTPLKYPDEEPFRFKLFSSDQLEQYGKHLATSHKLTLERPRKQLLTRLEENEHVLVGVYNQLTASVVANFQITPASEWLLDNFYLIEEQIHTAKRHLPKSYSRGLPRLLNGSLTGLPRVYDITLEGILYGKGLVDADSINNFVTAYQSVTALKLGELWAIPIMLRLALIENIRRIAVHISLSLIHI